MRTLFDMLDKDRRGYLEVSSLKGLLEQHGMDASLPQTLKHKYPNGRLNFHAFVQEFGRVPESYASPEVTRRGVRRTPGRSGLRSTNPDSTAISPILYSASVNALQDEVIQLKARLLSAEAETVHLRAALKQAEETTQRSVEAAEEQILQTETMRKALQESSEVRWKTEMSVMEQSKDDQIAELRRALAQARQQVVSAGTPGGRGDPDSGPSKAALRAEVLQLTNDLEIATQRLADSQITMAQLERQAQMAQTARATLDALARDKAALDEMNFTLLQDVDRLSKEVRALQVLLAAAIDRKRK